MVWGLRAVGKPPNSLTKMPGVNKPAVGAEPGPGGPSATMTVVLTEKESEENEHMGGPRPQTLPASRLPCVTRAAPCHQGRPNIHLAPLIPT